MSHSGIVLAMTVEQQGDRERGRWGSGVALGLGVGTVPLARLLP